jgi:hypothetical protein
MERTEESTLRALTGVRLINIVNPEVLQERGYPPLVCDCYGIHRFAIIGTGPMAPQGARLAQREQRHDAFQQRVRDAPTVIGARAGLA